MIRLFDGGVGSDSVMDLSRVSFVDSVVKFRGASSNQSIEE